MTGLQRADRALAIRPARGISRGTKAPAARTDSPGLPGARRKIVDRDLNRPSDSGCAVRAASVRMLASGGTLSSINTVHGQQMRSVRLRS